MSSGQSGEVEEVRRDKHPFCPHSCQSLTLAAWEVLCGETNLGSASYSSL